LLSLGALGATASAAQILNTGTPDGGFFGYTGYDIFVGQSIGIAFTPDQDYTLDDVGVWMMSNDFENPGAEFRLSLQLDASGSGTPSIPSGVEIEGWDMATTAIGWSPVLDVAVSTLNPVLSAGVTYWIVAESDEEAFVDAVWVWGSDWSPYYQGINDLQSGSGWFGGYGEGSTPGTVINASPVPTPGALCLLGAAGIGALRRRRR
jgi:MYXO-CTERM domain-containing protein